MKHLHVTDPDLRSRPNGAPAYYQGRPASLWIRVMKPCRNRAPRPAGITAP
jgi:hypothetical protein